MDSAYDGFVLLDWMAWMGYVTDRIQVNAQAQWSIEVLPPTAAKRLATARTLEGQGDDVVHLTGSPSIVSITTDADNDSIYVQYTDASGEEWDYLEAEPGGVESLSVVRGDGYLMIDSRGSWSISSQK